MRAVDEGLRTHLLRVYNYMGGGLAVTGLVAYLIFTFAVAQMAICRPYCFGQTLFASRRSLWVVHLRAAGAGVLLSLPHPEMSLARRR